MTKVLTHATVPGTDGDAVVVRFGNGARLHYAGTEREAESVAEAALGAVGAYLTFHSRRRAEFVRGEENVETLL